jgi:hypothetical protein
VKTAFFEAPKVFAGRETNSRIVIHDELKSRSKTIMVFDDFVPPAPRRQDLQPVTHRERLTIPVVVVFERVAVHGLVLSPMDAEVRLAIAIQIERAQSDAAPSGCLKMAVVMFLPCHVTSRGSPVFTETSFIA